MPLLLVPEGAISFGNAMTHDSLYFQEQEIVCAERAERLGLGNGLGFAMLSTLIWPRRTLASTRLEKKGGRGLSRSRSMEDLMFLNSFHSMFDFNIIFATNYFFDWLISRYQFHDYHNNLCSKSRNVRRFIGFSYYFEVSIV